MSDHTAERRLADLGIQLPAPPRPGGSYSPVQRWGDTLYVSGQGPRGNLPPAAGPVVGKLGTELTLDQGRDAARRCVLNLLSALRSELGTLNRVTKVLKLVGFVNVSPGFTDIPAVIDGASDLLVEVFGDRGYHARSAVGMAELPAGIAVEVEAIVVAPPGSCQ